MQLLRMRNVLPQYNRLPLAVFQSTYAIRIHFPRSRSILNQTNIISLSFAVNRNYLSYIINPISILLEKNKKNPTCARMKQRRDYRWTRNSERNSNAQFLIYSFFSFFAKKLPRVLIAVVSKSMLISAHAYTKKYNLFCTTKCRILTFRVHLGEFLFWQYLDVYFVYTLRCD